jgi:hypothetical protein
LSITLKYLRNFVANSISKHIFKATILKSLGGTRKDEGVRIVKLDITKYVTVKSTIFPYRNIYKYTWSLSNAKTQ